jgi:hypothetical protein
MPRELHDTESAGIDRRQETRHAVERPCRIALESPPLDELPGVTTNLSRSGMLVRFPDFNMLGELPKIGEQARVVIDLPPSDRFAPRTLECFVRVVRAEGSAGEAPALAFEVQRMQIRERGEREESDARDSSRLVQ